MSIKNFTKGLLAFFCISGHCYNLVMASQRDMPVKQAAIGTGAVSVSDLSLPDGASYVLAPGCRDIAICSTKISFIDGEAGKLYYRGYDIEDLARGLTFIDVAYLLVHGRLPLYYGESALRLTPGFSPLFPDLYERGMEALIRTEPMRVLQSGVLLFNMVKDTPYDARVNMMTIIPMAIATIHRRICGEALLRGQPGLSYGANFLYMLTGQIPSPQAARTMEILLILHAEHGLNASTATVRGIASTEASSLAAISAGIGALSGPRHGGASSSVVAMLSKLSQEHDIKAAVSKRLAQGAGQLLDEAQNPVPKIPVPGLGHRVYKTMDPRAKVLRTVLLDMLKPHLGADHEVYQTTDYNPEILRKVIQRLYKLPGNPIYDLVIAALEIETQARVHPYYHCDRRQIYPNVDFYSGLLYQMLGIRSEIAPLIFVAGRLVGWVAHYFEERHSRGPIIRPRSVYTGEVPRPLPGGYPPLPKTTTEGAEPAKPTDVKVTE